MPATTAAPNGATSATPQLRGDVFDARCAAILGPDATTQQKAELVGVDRVTLHRFRNGLMGPRLEVAQRFSRVLGLPIAELWTEVAA